MKCLLAILLCSLVYLASWTPSYPTSGVKFYAMSNVTTGKVIYQTQRTSRVPTVCGRGQRLQVIANFKDGSTPLASNIAIAGK